MFTQKEIARIYFVQTVMFTFVFVILAFFLSSCGVKSIEDEGEPQFVSSQTESNCAQPSDEIGNLLIEPENLSAAVWETNPIQPVLTTLNAAEGPLPNTRAHLLFDDGDENTYLYQDVPKGIVVENRDYEFEVFVKQPPGPATETNVVFFQRPIIKDPSGTTVTPVTAVMVAWRGDESPSPRIDTKGPGQHAYLIEDACNGWYKVTVKGSFLSGFGPDDFVRVEIQPAADKNVSKGGVLVYGPQLRLAPN